MSTLPEIQPGNAPANLQDYAYISSQSNDQVGIYINPAGTATDPDGNVVLVSLLPDRPNASPIFSGRNAVRQSTGTYVYTFLSTDTAQAGFYHLAWTYQINSVPDIFMTPIQIGEFNPAYDALSPEAKYIVELVWAMFADGYDSQFGGPNVQQYFQSHFSRGRLAQLLYIRLQTINIQGQPVNSWSLTGSNPATLNNGPIPGAYPIGTTPPALPPGTSPPWPPFGTPTEENTPSTVISLPSGPSFPYAQWSGLLISGLKIEVIKHLMRSYVEEPLAEGSSAARLTRRDYMSRWGEILRTEEAEYKEMLDVFKIRQMFALQPRVLVSGGVYGNYGPTRLAGNAAARPRYWARYF